MATLSSIPKLLTTMVSQCIWSTRPHYQNRRSTWMTVCTTYLLLTQFTTLILCKGSHSSSKTSVSTSLDLMCPPCEQLFCTPRNPKRLKCKGGITTGICSCCPVCARVEGETCGGEHDYLGKCDKGLVCSSDLVAGDSMNDVLKKTENGKESSVQLLSRPKGACKIDETFLHGFVGDQPMPSFCKPRCTPKYCERNPRAICSAIENADSSQECQEECQHTSCRACRYVYDSHPCGKCGQNDFKCMNKFGQCMRRRTCSRDGYPCKKPKQKNPFLKEAVFQCFVPGCL